MSPRSQRVAESITSMELTYPARSSDRPLRVYRPQLLRPRHPAVVVFLHGGAFVSGSLDDATPVAAEFARRLHVVVVAPDYTLASEKPFPEAVEDAYAAIVWTRDNAAWHGGDARRIAVAGEEAGGNLAAVSALMARDRGGPELAAQVLVSPMLDPTLTSRSMRDAGPAAGAHALDCFVAAYRRYLPRMSDHLHPYASPTHCSRLTGVAPALIISAQDDPLRDEAEAYGAALIATGVTTQVSRLKRIAAGARGWSEELWAAISAFLGPRLAHGSPS